MNTSDINVPNCLNTSVSVPHSACLHFICLLMMRISIFVFGLFFIFSFATAFVLTGPGGILLESACFPVCDEKENVPCGEPITSDCSRKGLFAASCSGTGSGRSWSQCLKKTGKYLASLNKTGDCDLELLDDCGNPCGVTFLDLGCHWSSCEEAVTSMRVPGIYDVLGREVYCNLEGYALMLRVSAGSRFFPFSLSAAQLPSPDDELRDHIVLTVEDPAGVGQVHEGHLNFTAFSEWTDLRFDCRLSPTAEFASYYSSALTEWLPADYPGYGQPSWVTISNPPVHWRGSHYICGTDLNPTSNIYGIGLCAGPGATGSYANHKATLNYADSRLSQIGCGGVGGTVGEFLLWAK